METRWQWLNSFPLCIGGSVMQWSRDEDAGTRDVILYWRQIYPGPAGLLVTSQSFFWFGVTEIIPVAHQLIDSVTASTWDFQHYSEGHLDTAGDQLPGTGAMWMMFCVISELILAIMWHKTSDATTGVHVMFHTVPMVNVMFSQSLICCFKNHRTRNITGLSILCGCFPSGWLSSAGHRRVLWWRWGVVPGHVRCQAVRWLRPLVNISSLSSGHSGVTRHCLHWPR